MEKTDLCPVCQSPLAPITETPNGRRLRRCSAGSWNPETRKVEGCAFVLWMPIEPEPLDETCPKCGKPLVLQITRTGKRMKRCSTGGWDKETKQATGCDYVEWIQTTREPLKEVCPKCKEPLVLMTTSSGKRMKKCSTATWDKETKTASGCDYVEWLK